MHYLHQCCPSHILFVLLTSVDLEMIGYLLHSTIRGYLMGTENVVVHWRHCPSEIPDLCSIYSAL